LLNVASNDNSAIYVWCDEVRLTSDTWSIFLGNAVKFTNKGGIELKIELSIALREKIDSILAITDALCRARYRHWH
jgi:hypothetical protein